MSKDYFSVQWEARRIYFLQWFSSSVFCGPSWIMTWDHWNGMPAVYSGSLNGIMACLLSVIGSRYRTNNTITDTSTPYERHGVSNCRQLDCSFSYLFATRAKNTITPHHWPIVREMFRLSSTKVKNAERVSMSRHQGNDGHGRRGWDSTKHG